MELSLARDIKAKILHGVVDVPVDPTSDRYRMGMGLYYIDGIDCAKSDYNEAIYMKFVDEMAELIKPHLSKDKSYWYSQVDTINIHQCGGNGYDRQVRVLLDVVD